MEQAGLALLVVVQLLYFFGMLVTYWFLGKKVELVDRNEQPPADLPDIVLFYPVLRELEATMRTTFSGMASAEYPSSKFRVISIPNHDDEVTIAALRTLQQEFPFLEVMPVPATTDPSWQLVWDEWEANPKAYWWHEGKRQHERALPPKKTRQLIWAMYHVAQTSPDALLSYIDADSVIPSDYFRTAAIGMQHFDVIQNTNITGNLMDTWATSLFAMDHILWDATIYPHMTAEGKHPFYVLGKGLFYRFRDLIAVGGFHPWLTIEDPEIGMRLWTNGARLGVVRSPLIEEVPATLTLGVTQRKRWIAGFFQSLGAPLRQMGMPLRKRVRARMNFVPCLSLVINPVGMLIGAWVLAQVTLVDHGFVQGVLMYFCMLNLVLAIGLLSYAMWRAFRMTAPVLETLPRRIWYLIRVNPIFLIGYWAWWTIPLVIGLVMYIRDTGLTWERTVKIDANADLIESILEDAKVR